MRQRTMKNLIFILLVSFFSISTYAQEKSEPTIYKYIVVEVKGQFLYTKCRVYVDDGRLKTKQNYKNNKKAYTFETHAAALDYFTCHGWELVGNNNNTHGYAGTSSTSIYWILRKPSTKEEIGNILKESVVEVPGESDDIIQ